MFFAPDDPRSRPSMMPNTLMPSAGAFISHEIPPGLGLMSMQNPNMYDPMHGLKSSARFGSTDMKSFTPAGAPAQGPAQGDGMYVGAGQSLSNFLRGGTPAAQPTPFKPPSLMAGDDRARNLLMGSMLGVIP